MRIGQPILEVFKIESGVEGKAPSGQLPRPSGSAGEVPDDKLLGRVVAPGTRTKLPQIAEFGGREHRRNVWTPLKGAFAAPQLCLQATAGVE
jgi:hypothetical protein